MSDPVESMINEYAKHFPPLLTLAHAAEILHVKRATIHGRSSRGDFDAFKIGNGRRTRLKRDEFIRCILKDNTGK